MFQVSSSRACLVSITALMLAAFSGCSGDEDPADTGGSSGLSGSSSGSSGAGTSSGNASSGGGSSGASSSSGGPATANLTWTAATVTGTSASNVGAITAIGYGGGRFVAYAIAAVPAVDNAGYALTSSDGKSWTVTKAFSLNYGIGAIAYVGSKFVAVGDEPDGEGGRRAVIAESADGTEWTFSPGAGDGYNAATVIGDTMLWTGSNGAGDGGFLNYRIGGAAPIASSLGVTTPMHALCTVGTRVIAVGAGGPDRPTFVYSDTPTNPPWTAGSNDLLRGFGSMLGVSCDETRQVAVGRGNDVLISKDHGASWSLITEGSSTTWTAVVKAGGKTVAVGWNGVYGVIDESVAVGSIGAPLRYELAASNGTTVVAAGEAGAFSWTTP